MRMIADLFRVFVMLLILRMTLPPVIDYVRFAWWKLNGGYSMHVVEPFQDYKYNVFIATPDSIKNINDSPTTLPPDTLLSQIPQLHPTLSHHTPQINYYWPSFY